jgi:hypothetical protein
VPTGTGVAGSTRSRGSGGDAGGPAGRGGSAGSTGGTAGETGGPGVKPADDKALAGTPPAAEARGDRHPAASDSEAHRMESRSTT